MNTNESDPIQIGKKISPKSIIYLIVVLIVMLLILVNNLGVLLELIGLDSVALPDWLLLIVATIALFITVGSLVFALKNRKNVK